MPDVGMIPFARFFPEQAETETRVMIIQGHRSPPDDEYGLIELYCSDSQCDCRRVLLSVIARRQQTVMATIGFGFDREAAPAGPYLDPLNPQSKYADFFLKVTAKTLDDPAYVACLEQHYRQVKEATADPAHPIQAILAEIARAQADAPRPQKAQTRVPRNPPKQNPPRARADRPPEGSVPKATSALYEKVTSITDAFCQEHLDPEYAQLCRKLTAALCRKRPSPLTQGKIEIWAAAVIYALGSVNFLFDKSQTPHLSAGQLCELLGTNQRTTSAKARTISNLLAIGVFDPRWYRPSRLASNPRAWMVELDGFIVDVRTQPREIQEEAYRLGLIPYLP